jgi:hypothetical protein
MRLGHDVEREPIAESHGPAEKGQPGQPLIGVILGLAATLTFLT